MAKENSTPKAKEIPKELESHGHLRVDPYFWLRDKENPETIAYLEAENHYREEQTAHLKSFETDLFSEMKSRIKEDDSSVPYFKNQYWYYVRYNEGQEHPIYCRKLESLEASEEIILDANIGAKQHDYYQVAGMSISPDNQWLAYGLDTLGRRINQIHFKNLSTGETLEESLPNNSGSCSWSSDGQYVFYTQKDETLRSHKVYRHRFGTKAKEDKEIYHEEDSTFVCSCYKSKSQDYIIIGSHSTVSNEYHYLNASNPKGEFQLIQARERDLEYSVAHFGEYWYIRTNINDAQNFCLMRCPIELGPKENWEVVVPHRPEVYLEGIEIFEDFLVLEERERGLTRIRIHSWDGENDHYLDFGSETYTAGTGLNLDFQSKKLRYYYSSLVEPYSVVEYDMLDRTKKILKRQPVLGDFNFANYREERHWFKSHDGTEIPVSLIYRPDKQKAGEAQNLLLYAYGSYGYTIEPSFSSTRLSLLDRGFTFAIAHIRGGQYLGRQWYENGKMLKKKNSFLDFIAAGEGLIGAGLTSADKLFAMGGSAGGLLMGAVINLKPEIFKAVIAAVPFVDVVSTMLDESIPLTTGEYDEWGNPNDEEYYHYMLSYSPYDQVKEQHYPNLLITSGLHDSQVQYWEPAKWCAKLRKYKMGDSLVLMYTNMSSGHSGASGRFEALKETAMEYSFILWQAGIEK